MVERGAQAGGALCGYMGDAPGRGRRVLRLRGRDPRQVTLDAVLGGYSVLTTSTYSAKAVSRWFVYHLGELDLAVGVLPLAAFLLLLFVAVRPRPFLAQARVFAVVALSAAIWLLAEVAAFASSPFGRQIQERNVFYLEPLFMIALAVWAFGKFPGRPGRPRWRRLSPRPSSAPSPSTRSSAPARSRTRSVSCRSGGSSSAVRSPGATRARDRPRSHLCGADLHPASPPLPARRACSRVALPGLGELAGRGNNEPGIEGLARRAAFKRRGTGSTTRWAPEPDVAAIWTGAPGLNFVALWDNEFFNRSVGPVYNINGPPDGLPQETIMLDPASASLQSRGRHAAPGEVRPRRQIDDDRRAGARDRPREPA